MKLERLLGILSWLLEHQTATASELAEVFEVSKRTILRDLDSLDLAGFPIMTRQGAGGGISLMEGYRIDSKVLKREDLQNIITGLKGLKSISGDKEIGQLLHRLSYGEENIISLDLSGFYKDSLTEKIGLLIRAVSEEKCVRFLYFSPGKEEWRDTEPIRIQYRWADWYLLAWCRTREDFRLFKLNRLWHLSVTGEACRRHPVPEERNLPQSHLDDTISLEVLFDPSVKHILVESYGPDSFTAAEDNKLLFKRGFTNKEYVLQWLLPFGDKAFVVNPPSIAIEIKKIGENLARRYS